MKLAVHELTASGLSQSFTPTGNKSVEAIRPHLYVKGTPTGSLILSLLTSDGSLLAQSPNLTISTISTALEFHGYITFYLSASLRQGQTYQFKITGADGYTFQESAYVGVCGDFDLNKYTSAQPPTHYLTSPLDFEIWTLTRK